METVIRYVGIIKKIIGAGCNEIVKIVPVTHVSSTLIKFPCLER